MRLLVKQVLRSVIMTELDKRASCSRTVKLWRDSLVKPVIIMIRHMSAAEEMLQCFHAARCNNYAGYFQFDVHHIKGLNHVLIKKLQDGAFVCHIHMDRYVHWVYLYASGSLSWGSCRLGDRLEPDGYLGSKFCHMRITCLWCYKNERWATRNDWYTPQRRVTSSNTEW